ncbi:MAG: LEA type 2 family protein, partial [Gammaproteobacteria bacterium]|nr:LEA type 2 family protein [Gammaproteobacteria bacterium]
PSIEYVNHTLRDVNLTQATIDANLKAKNPNEIGLKNVFLSYELYVEGKRFLKGSDIAVALTPKGESMINVPAVVVYKDIYNAVGPVAERILMNQKSVAVTIIATLYGNPTVYNEVEQGSLFQFSMTMEKTVDVPLPQDKIDKAKEDVKNAIKKLF